VSVRELSEAMECTSDDDSIILDGRGNIQYGLELLADRLEQ